jgi:signal transduction histidine kinase
MEPSQTHDDEMYTLAHNLRSPLTIVIALAAELEVNCSTIPEDELCNWLQAIRRNGHKMNNIINEFVLHHSTNGGKHD